MILRNLSVVDFKALHTDLMVTSSNKEIDLSCVPFLRLFTPTKSGVLQMAPIFTRTLFQMVGDEAGRMAFEADALFVVILQYDFLHLIVVYNNILRIILEKGLAKLGKVSFKEVCYVVLDGVCRFEAVALLTETKLC